MPAEKMFRIRARLKRVNHEPIRVLFVCFEPSMWGMFESIYGAMIRDPRFTPLVVTLPYMSKSLPPGQHKETCIFEFLKSNGITAIHGFEKNKNEWLNPKPLKPDYVFFQQPYEIHHSIWSIKNLSSIARVCYLPYGTLLAQGELAQMVLPETFFKNVSLFFMESFSSKDFFEKNFHDKYWFDSKKIKITGYPKYDYLLKKERLEGKVWKQGLREDTKRILWTPRWNTREGTCHFFNYQDYFFEFCQKHTKVDFVFRPHPFCFDEFLTEGKLSPKSLEELKQQYASSLNMTIDGCANYEEVFMTSHFLISDFSSMLIEYFATGKPIIYTHRKNIFNEYGNALSEGFYWVRNEKELEAAILMLLAGKDPLRPKREALMRSLFFMPKEGAGERIKEEILNDFLK